MHIPEGFRVRQILDETLAVPGGEVAKQFAGIISLNEVGRFLFELLQMEQTTDSLVAALLESYDVDQATAEQDVAEFLSHLRNADLLID